MKISKRIVSGVLCAMTAAAPMSQALVTVAEDSEETVYSAPISEVVQDSGLDIDYARSLQYSLYFYDANMCGDTVSDHTRLSWRGNCHAYDAHVPMIEWDGLTTKSSAGGTNLSAEFMEKYKDILDPDGDGTIDVAGGFHDAGDHVEFGMPENYTAATLGWGYYEYRDVYKKLEQDSHMETILRHFNDYLMKCTFLDKDGTVIAHCYQVGEGGIDHSIWNCPEVDTMPRPAFFLTADKPQTDYVVSACASLAINYLNFKDTDPTYAEKSLDYAKALWKFANDNPKELSDNADGPVRFYQSDHWEDDYCWAAAWMYLATGDSTVFDNGAYKVFDYYAPSGWAYCWNDMWSGAALMWAVINEQHPELDMVNQIRKAQGKNEYVFKDFWDDDCLGKCLRTWQQLESPGGFAFLNQWGSCRYNTAMQMICLLYDKYHNNGEPSEWSEWAKKQMDYVLGKNDITYKEEPKYSVLAGLNGTHGPRSFVVGYNDTAVKNPHHRAASGLLMAEDPREQKHILWGALAGGPDGNDGHDDATKDWTENEVTIDYNACLPAASAGLYAVFGTPDMAITPNFPPEDEKRAYSNGGEGGSGYWIEAVALDKPNGGGAGTTQVSFKVLTGENKPSTDTTVRYYFNVSECANGIAGVTTASELYDQSQAEDREVGADGVLSGPFKYDKTPDTYYIEVNWKDYIIANSGKKYQFAVGMYYGDTWDPTNDWSYKTMKIGEEGDFAAVDNPPEVKNENICIYVDGVLVGGIEPDGSTPVIEDKTEEPSTQTNTENELKVTLWGDVNCDKEVNMADAVLIMQFLSNPDVYGKNKPDGISSLGCLNGDVYNNGDGLTNSDASAIQEYKLGLRDTLPVK